MVKSLSNCTRVLLPFQKWYHWRRWVTKGGGQCSITRHPSSRAADEGATVCMSCQHWGKLGMCQPCSSHSLSPTRNTPTRSHPLLSAHIPRWPPRHRGTGGSICLSSALRSTERKKPTAPVCSCVKRQSVLTKAFRYLQVCVCVHIVRICTADLR